MAAPYSIGGLLTIAAERDACLNVMSSAKRGPSVLVRLFLYDMASRGVNKLPR